jgi:hypothetical protein
MSVLGGSRVCEDAMATGVKGMTFTASPTEGSQIWPPISILQAAVQNLRSKTQTTLVEQPRQAPTLGTDRWD